MPLPGVQILSLMLFRHSRDFPLYCTQRWVMTLEHNFTKTSTKLLHVNNH